VNGEERTAIVDEGASDKFVEVALTVSIQIVEAELKFAENRGVKRGIKRVGRTCENIRAALPAHGA